MKLGVRLEETVILKFADLCRVLQRGRLVVYRKPVSFLVIFCGFSAEYFGETELETGFNEDSAV